MAQLYFKYGAMGSSKTANALMARFNYEERGQATLLVKPRLDTRDGDHMVYSRIGLKHPCIYFDEMRAMPEEEKERTLHNYRLAFRADTMVNWCPKLGTVLANDEVHDGLSVRGGHPVEQKRMKQWLLRVTAYAQRMLDGLDRLAWSDSLKEIQRNWIGGGPGLLRHKGFGAQTRNIHHPPRHDLRRDVHGHRPRTRVGGRTDHARQQGGRRGVHLPGQETLRA